MPNELRGPVSLAGRILLCTIFLMSAIGNKIPNYGGVAGAMREQGVPLPEGALAVAILFLLAGSFFDHPGLLRANRRGAAAGVSCLGDVLLSRLLDLRRSDGAQRATDSLLQECGVDGRHADDHRQRCGSVAHGQWPGLQRRRLTGRGALTLFRERSRR